MDIKAVIVQNVIDITGNLIADQINKPDWDARRMNIEQYYKDLEPIRETLPEAPDVREPREQRGEIGNVAKIVGEICTPDLSPKELSECKSCVKEVLEGSSSDVMQKYFESANPIK
ncbi:unnamed protein product [marine sediment metagenome]|uniref:Uncharacterized protein n=1 Tax=marine sediment metagenome TaxID=412755 RepID=X1BYI6_9ZZZZ